LKEITMKKDLLDNVSDAGVALDEIENAVSDAQRAISDLQSALEDMDAEKDELEELKEDNEKLLEKNAELLERNQFYRKAIKDAALAVKALMALAEEIE